MKNLIIKSDVEYFLLFDTFISIILYIILIIIDRSQLLSICSVLAIYYTLSLYNLFTVSINNKGIKIIYPTRLLFFTKYKTKYIYYEQINKIKYYNLGTGRTYPIFKVYVNNKSCPVKLFHSFDNESTKIALKYFHNNSVKIEVICVNDDINKFITELNNN